MFYKVFVSNSLLCDFYLVSLFCCTVDYNEQ